MVTRPALHSKQSARLVHPRHHAAAFSCGGAVLSNRELSNKGLHQTGRGGVAFAFRRRPVVEARPAGEATCWADH